MAEVVRKSASRTATKQPPQPQPMRLCSCYACICRSLNSYRVLCLTQSDLKLAGQKLQGIKCELPEYQMQMIRDFRQLVSNSSSRRSWTTAPVTHTLCRLCAKGSSHIAADDGD